MKWIKPTTFQGSLCTLQPLSFEHHDDLIESLNDGELWNLWYTFIPKPEELKNEIARKLALYERGTVLAFATIENHSGKAVGLTTYLNIDPVNRRLEIGGTWLRKRAQKTGINTESKLLLLTHAFESLQCNAVEFRTHFCNHQSRRGIENVGAKFDGVLRNHMVMPDGTLRDTCVYSIIKSEWPTVKKHLSWRLAKSKMIDCVFS